MKHKTIAAVLTAALLLAGCGQMTATTGSTTSSIAETIPASTENTPPEATEGTPEEIKAAAEKEGVSLREYEAEHGEPAVEEVDMDADGFADQLESYCEKVNNTALKDDLQRLADESRRMVETRDVNDVENTYHLLHDLDYWLLNYRLDTEGAYIEDKSTIGKYYGELSSY